MRVSNFSSCCSRDAGDDLSDRPADFSYPLKPHLFFEFSGSKQEVEQQIAETQAITAAHKVCPTVQIPTACPLPLYVCYSYSAFPSLLLTVGRVPASCSRTRRKRRTTCGERGRRPSGPPPPCDPARTFSPPTCASRSPGKRANSRDFTVCVLWRKT